jgi:hypothetical protein
MKNYIKIIVLLLSSFAFAQNGRMYIPSELSQENADEMRALGMEMSIEDVYSVADGSVKDAIIHFNGGCTAEVISKQGLVLTNHHCGYSAIQSHSTVDNDYLHDGFWAMSKAEELENPDMVVTFIKRIDNVTNEVLAGINDTMDEATKKKLINKNLDNVSKNAKKEAWQDVFIKSFFDGNEYHLFVTETYKDIRLVGAPPSSIGKFGADTDNWMFPRHSGDFSLFRIYADKNNKPATYSKDNVPYKPVHALPVSVDGVAEDDFTLVYGFPGRTSEYLPAVAVDQIVHKVNPAGIEVREKALAIVDKYMRKDPKIKIQYASKFASIANYWKKWIGENQGIEKSNAIAKKKEFEKEFTKRVNEKGLTNKYGSLLTDFDKYYAEKEEIAVTRNYLIEVMYRNTELLNTAFRLYQLENTLDKKGEKTFNKAKINLLKSLKGKYANYNAEVDKAVFAKLTALYKEKVNPNYVPTLLQNTDVAKLTKGVYKKSALTNYNALEKLLNIKDSKALLKKLKKDKGYKIGREFAALFFNKVNPKYQAVNQKINAVQRNYMKAIMVVFPEKQFAPDANSTLRITYGQVKGYEPKDAVYYKPVSHLGGVMQKYIPGDYEFDVSPKLQALYKAKDFGTYADKEGKLAVNFLGTNHTTGGNSGSPVLDANGNLIGLNFDRVWEGTMSDMNYDPTICRNIMVDVRYILFIIDKYAGATNLIDEMELVHPKAKN